MSRYERDFPVIELSCEPLCSTLLLNYLLVFFIIRRPRIYNFVAEIEITTSLLFL